MRNNCQNSSCEQNDFIEATPVQDTPCGCQENYDLVNWNDCPITDGVNGVINTQLDCRRRDGRGENCFARCEGVPPCSPCEPRETAQRARHHCQCCEPEPCPAPCSCCEPESCPAPCSCCEPEPCEPCTQSQPAGEMSGYQIIDLR